MGSKFYGLKVYTKIQVFSMYELWIYVDLYITPPKCQSQVLNSVSSVTSIINVIFLVTVSYRDYRIKILIDTKATCRHCCFGEILGIVCL